MPPMLRNILAVRVGIVPGAVAVTSGEALGHTVLPAPAGPDMKDPAQLATLMDQLPVGALVSVLLASALVSFVGAAAATAPSRTSRTRVGLVVGGVLMLFGCANLVATPHPGWMVVGTFAAFLPAAYAGAGLVLRWREGQQS